MRIVLDDAETARELARLLDQLAAYQERYALDGRDAVVPSDSRIFFAMRREQEKPGRAGAAGAGFFTLKRQREKRPRDVEFLSLKGGAKKLPRDRGRNPRGQASNGVDFPAEFSGW